MNNMFSLKGKTALITGGNGGIGNALANGFASSGSNIIIAARNKDKTDAAVDELAKKYDVKVKGFIVDVRKEQEILKTVEQATADFGQIDILVNNAGMNVRKLAQDIDITEWDAVLETNARGSFIFAKAVYPGMKKAGSGKIINIASMLSLFGGAMVAPYATSKGGVVQLTKCLACAWAPDNIQVNAILPGWINTEMTQRGRREIQGLEERVIVRTPAGRWGEPEELAGAAIFLASKASDFLTGTSLIVDGGYSIMM